MSDILIKNMDMPKNCMHCLLRETRVINGRRFELCKKLSDDMVLPYAIERDGRRKDCPLVEIPPHGRLIDADKEVTDWEITKTILEECEDTKRFAYRQACIVIDALKDAPTVLEASE